MGLPIVGDEKYGGTWPYLSQIKKKYVKSKKEGRQEESPLVRRLVLHAKALTYLPFKASSPHTIECPEADDIVKFCQKLEKFAS
jgi:23S rRNA pseudouridine955/2504/2580 synthase